MASDERKPIGVLKAISRALLGFDALIDSTMFNLQRRALAAWQARVCAGIREATPLSRHRRLGPRFPMRTYPDPSSEDCRETSLSLAIADAAAPGPASRS